MNRTQTSTRIDLTARRLREGALGVAACANLGLTLASAFLGAWGLATVGLILLLALTGWAYLNQ